MSKDRRSRTMRHIGRMIWTFWLLLGQFFAMTETTDEDSLSETSMSDCNLIQLGEMVKMKTSRSWADYSDYGHWCGFGGSGQPVDVVDKCCRSHDHCYDNLSVRDCGDDYLFKAYTEHYKWWIKGEKKDIICSNVSRCSQAICKCDRGLAACLGRTDRQYDKRKSGMLYKRLFSGLLK